MVFVVQATRNGYSPVCDRRRSRAARELLRSHLIRAWQDTHRIVSSTSENHHHGQYNVDVSEWNIWQLLDATIVKNNDNDIRQQQPTCPLLPLHDIYKQHEESIRIFDATSTMIPKRIRNSAIPGILHHNRTVRKAGGKTTSRQLRQLYPLIYHCDMCQKNFTSQYYLDQHLISKHPIIENTNNTSASVGKICPADTYCSFLSPTACYDYMIQEEPQYGPGNFLSDHLDDESQFNSSVACDEKEQQKAIQTCHDIVAMCFDETIRGRSSNTFGQILSTNMCSTIPNCQTRLVHNVLHTISDNMRRRSHSFFQQNPFEYWTATINDHFTATTWMALLIVTSLFTLIFGHYVYQLSLAIQQRQHRSRQHRSPTDRTNISPPTNNHSRTSVVPPPTTYIVPMTTTKTKLT